MKYEIGDFVSKSVTGVCKIEDIVSLDLTGKKENKLYYLMKSIEDEKGKLYVPVSNSDAILRLCLTKEEAWKLIERIPEIPTAWIDNEKMREQKYKATVKSNDPEALISIYKNDLSAEKEKTCTREKMYNNRCKIFSDSRKPVIHGTWSSSWKTERGSL